MITSALIGVALLFGLLVLGVPVAFSLLLSGGIGLYLVGDYYMIAGILKSVPYEHVASYTLSTLPVFILMAEFLTVGNFTRDIFSLAYRMIGHTRGGVTYAAVAGGVVLAAISGSSTAAASTLASAAYPEMKRFNYDSSFSAGALSVIGTLAIMIPPSLGLVLFGVFTETSVGRLLVAGAIPGILTGVGYILTIWIMVRLKPELAPVAHERFSWSERRESVKAIWPVMLLLFAMVFGLYSGIITPTEVGAVGALLALIIGLCLRRINLQGIKLALYKASRSSAMILTIVGFAGVFGVFLTMTGLTQELLDLVDTSNFNRWIVLGCVLLILLVLGFFLDQLAILILTLPIAFPLLTSLEFSPVWLGVLFVKTAEIGLVSPPMGMNVFVVSGVTGVPISKVFKGVTPFILVEFIILSILIAIPETSTWLPELVYGK